MPQNEEVQLVRKKYGLVNEDVPENPKNKIKKKEEPRNHDRERTILLGALEKIAKMFQKQMAQGDFALDNDSRFVEEFCTIIELCIQHGWKNSGSGVIKSRDCFWIVLENYAKKHPSDGSNQTAYDIVRNHLILPNNMSKLRAWIRTALAKKILVSELRNAVGIVKKLDLCFYKWSITRNDTFNTWLTVVDSLSKIDFNILVKESTLNLSDKPIKWTDLVDSDGLHLDKFAPYLSLENEEDSICGDEADVDKALIRQVGFLEDENIRLRRSVLQQLNHNSKAEAFIEDLSSKLKASQSYVTKLEEEIQRLQRIKYELEERIVAHESTNQISTGERELSQVMKELVGIHWFRKGLRLHDNPALVKALEKCQKVYPVFVWDPFFAKNNFAGPNRWRFLVESLKDLDENLRKLNSRLFVFRGNPTTVLPEIFKEWNIGLISFEEDTEPYAKIRDNFITEHCNENKIEIVSFPSHTLYDMKTLYKINGNKVCTTYSSFTNLLDKVGLPETSCPPITKPFPSLENNNIFDPELYKLPTLEDDCCLSDECIKKFSNTLSKYPGGESKALERLEQHVKNVKWICTFEKPETLPNSLEPSTTVLSPYLKFGCLSVKHFREKLIETYATGKKRAEHWGMRQVTLEGQLIWREFYYFCGAFTPNFDKISENPICRQIKWDSNPEYLQAWKDGKTGYPFIDAIMNQLREEGWIHHLARHAVACFLTRGDLYQSWEDGARIFEYYLLDADWSLNNGNWMWLSCSAFFHQYFRVYSPVAFGKKTDAEGNYIRKYVPELKNFPTKYIYEPWTAPIAIQKQAGCIIGKDYPKPIVDHALISKKNMARMKEYFGHGGDVHENPNKKPKLK